MNLSRPRGVISIFARLGHNTKSMNGPLIIKFLAKYQKKKSDRFVR